MISSFKKRLRQTASVAACALAFSCALPLPTLPKPQAIVDPVNTTDPASALLITEIGSAFISTPTVSTWIEVYNRSANLVTLSSYQLRASSRNTAASGVIGLDVTYDLPDVSLLPGTYALVRAKPNVNFVNGGNTAFVNQAAGSGFLVPRFGQEGDGFVELTYGRKSVDFVRFGVSSNVPSSGFFMGSAPAVPASNELGYGFSIARNGANADSDAGSDWCYVATATPGGPNDVTDGTDSDDDGIPDVCEKPGSTFAGLPLYDWGARAGRRDIFIHVDYMSMTDPGILPNESALNLVREAFRRHGIEVHFDVGDLFVSRVDTNRHNLGSTSHLVPYAPGMQLGETGQGQANLYAYKNAYFPLARRNIFHYLMFANSKNADGSIGSSGVAEMQGNDILISMGKWFDGVAVDLTNIVVHWQASTVMHELGHNLGLRHGGFEDNNRKPNYISIMNYSYQLCGLPVIGSTMEGDRWYFENGQIKGIDSYYKLTNGPNRSPGVFLMDYSGGKSMSLSESMVNEGSGLGRPGSSFVDYNNNDAVDSAIAIDLNPNNRSGSGETLQDYDDWGNLYLTFQRSRDGDNSGVAVHTRGFFMYKGLGQDVQEVGPPCPTPQPINRKKKR